MIHHFCIPSHSFQDSFNLAQHIHLVTEYYSSFRPQDTIHLQKNVFRIAPALVWCSAKQSKHRKMNPVQEDLRELMARQLSSPRWFLLTFHVFSNLYDDRDTKHKIRIQQPNYFISFYLIRNGGEFTSYQISNQQSKYKSFLLDCGVTAVFFLFASLQQRGCKL